MPAYLPTSLPTYPPTYLPTYLPTKLYQSVTVRATHTDYFTLENKINVSLCKNRINVLHRV